jgi:two-component system CheB/CheR fusion protein
MDAELQKKLLKLFFYSINPEGIMVLGSAETPGKQSHLFTPVDTKCKIYKRSITSQIPELFDFPSSFSRTKPVYVEKQIPVSPTVNIQTLADQLILQYFSPAGVLVNENGDIIYISGHTGKYLEPAVGKANMNIFAMLREGLHNEFPPAFRKAITKKEPVILRNLKIGTNGKTQTLNIKIQWIDQPELLKSMVMVIFSDLEEIPDIKTLSKTRKKISDKIRQSELEIELLISREEIQNTLEEMQTSQEELKSTNEELQSTNEELQSTNEELTTSKEEMQSLNEELQTVNAELQSKLDDYSRLNNDMKNLLNSTDIATLFLDKELNIRRFTIQATKIFKLIKSDIGRPFTDLVTDLIYPGLEADSIEVLRTLVFMQKQIPAKDGRWFSIRIMPYRTSDDRIDGLVITFINLSDLKQVEVKLHEIEQMNSLLLNSSSDVIIKLSTDWKIEEFNSEAEKFFGKKRGDALNQDYFQMFIPEPVRKQTEKNMKKMLNGGSDSKFKTKVIAAGDKTQVVELSVNVLVNDRKRTAGMIIITKKIT